MRKVYRSRYQAVLFVLIGIVAVTAQVIIAFGSPEGNLPVRLVALGFALILLAACFRAVISGVYPSGDGVKIVNPFSARTLSWSQIERFSLQPFLLTPRMGSADLWDGSRVHIFGIAAPSPIVFSRHRKTEDLIEELNEELRRSRSLA